MSGIRISPRKIDQDQEKSIIIQAITDEAFCRAILPIAKPEYFDINYAKKVFIWVKRYYEQYECPPQRYIQDIFNSERKNLSPEDAELIGDFISSLSDKYAEGGEKKNSKYYIDEATKYLKKQSYIRLSEGLASYAKLGQLDECEKLTVDHKKVSAVTSGFIDPHDPAFIKETMEAKETDVLFKIPGPLGELIKPERGRLLAFLAAPKVGKTWMLKNLGLLAEMNGLKVIECNLEMSAKKINYRYLKQISSLPDKDGLYKWTVADCRLNQLNICQKKQRTNKIALINNVGELPEYESRPNGYMPCAACRGTQDFELAFWFDSQYKEKMTLEKAQNINRGFSMMYGGGKNYRLKSYPKFSATVEDIERDLDSLAYSSDFIGDVLLVDYADILAPLHQNREVRHQLDETWKALGRIATQRNMLVITASQTNREGSKKKNVGGDSISENFLKLAHLDTLISCSQTPEEKKNGILRLAVNYDRDGEAPGATRQIAVFQSLALGQSFIDSEWVGNTYKEE